MLLRGTDVITHAGHAMMGDTTSTRGNVFEWATPRSASNAERNDVIDRVSSCWCEARTRTRDDSPMKTPASRQVFAGWISRLGVT
jgi:hypothetical protein